MASQFSQFLLAWYAQHARRLPWRDHPDPYVVWVSEIMLQQTRVETVIPYFERWMQRFPDIRRLAAASQHEVLSLWEGMGYYSRARSLHQTAQLVLAEYGGQLPVSAAELQKLPGIGRYTAGAIASMAFGQDEPALDGNIRRVLARCFNVAEPARSPAGEKRLWRLAGELLPAGRAGDFNQALMDLGTAVCTPRAPDCGGCPLKKICQARQLGLQEKLPVVESRPSRPEYSVTAAVIQREPHVLIAQRRPNGLLGGLWEFPGGKLQPGEDLAQCLQREILEELGADIRVGCDLGVYRHAYTHFRVTLHAFACELVNGSQPKTLEHSALRWVTIDELKEYPMGKIDRQIALRLKSQTNNPYTSMEKQPTLC